MLPVVDCPTNADWRAYTLGTLSDEESDGLFDHLANCPECQREMETVENASDSLLEMLSAPESERSFESEPNCQLAIARAVDAYSQAASCHSHEAELHFPKQVGEYEIIRALGHGGMGSVYLARHTKLERLVALKVLAAHRLTLPRMRRRFDIEMQAIGRLSHPNIVIAHDAREIDGTPVLVTEFIDGMDLEQIIRRVGALPVAEACEIARQVSVALQYVSDQGFVHRDIKPSNIMLSRDGQVKLLDLGLARFDSNSDERMELTGTGQTMGTADFVAPEQITDSRLVDVRADLYSVGCSLFKLLTGEPPFASPEYSTVFAKLTAHVSDEPPRASSLNPEVTSELDRLIQRLLEKKPEKRLQKPMEVAEQLATLSKGSDLKSLVRRADEVVLPIESQSSAVEEKVVTLQAEAEPRRVPLAVAIASGFLGLVLGLMLGLIIRIKNPDGSITEIHVPDGAQVEIAEDRSGNHASTSTHTFADDEEPAGFQGSFNAVSLLVRGEPHTLFDQKPSLILEGKTYRLVSEGSLLDRGVIKESETDSRQVLLHSDGDKSSKSVATCELLGDDSLLVEFDAGQLPSDPEFDLPPEELNEQVSIRFERVFLVGPLVASEATETGNTLRPLAQFVAEEVVDGLSVRPLQSSLREEISVARRARIQLNGIGEAFHDFMRKELEFPASAANAPSQHSANRFKHPVSWRVQLLPYLGDEELYRSYRFDEPWDSENNLRLVHQMPSYYRSPYALATQPSGETNYQGFSGNQTAIGVERGALLADVSHGLAGSLLVVDTRQSVVWTSPEDLPTPHSPSFRTMVRNGELNLSPFFLLADGTIQSWTLADFDRIESLISFGERVDAREAALTKSEGVNGFDTELREAIAGRGFLPKLNAKEVYEQGQELAGSGKPVLISTSAGQLVSFPRGLGGLSASEDRVFLRQRQASGFFLMLEDKEAIRNYKFVERILAEVANGEIDLEWQFKGKIESVELSYVMRIKDPKQMELLVNSKNEAVADQVSKELTDELPVLTTKEFAQQAKQLFEKRDQFKVIVPIDDLVPYHDRWPENAKSSEVYRLMSEAGILVVFDGQEVVDSLRYFQSLKMTNPTLGRIAIELEGGVVVWKRDDPNAEAKDIYVIRVISPHHFRLSTVSAESGAGTHPYHDPLSVESQSDQIDGSSALTDSPVVVSVEELIEKGTELVQNRTRVVIVVPADDLRGVISPTSNDAEANEPVWSEFVSEKESRLRIMVKKSAEMNVKFQELQQLLIAFFGVSGRAPRDRTAIYEFEGHLDWQQLANPARQKRGFVIEIEKPENLRIRVVPKAEDGKKERTDN